jgi:hypothetical protein
VVTCPQTSWRTAAGSVTAAPARPGPAGSGGARHLWNPRIPRPGTRHRSRAGGLVNDGARLLVRNPAALASSSGAVRQRANPLAAADAVGAGQNAARAGPGRRGGYLHRQSRRSGRR